MYSSERHRKRKSEIFCGHCKQTVTLEQAAEHVALYWLPSQQRWRDHNEASPADDTAARVRDAVQQADSAKKLRAAPATSISPSAVVHRASGSAAQQHSAQSEPRDDQMMDDSNKQQRVAQDREQFSALHSAGNSAKAAAHSPARAPVGDAAFSVPELEPAPAADAKSEDQTEADVNWHSATPISQLYSRETSATSSAHLAPDPESHFLASSAGDSEGQSRPPGAGAPEPIPPDLKVRRS